MAKRTVIDERIENLEQAWSGTNEQGKEWGYKKNRIEEIIKRYLSGHDRDKFGSILATTDDNGLTTVNFFANDDARDLWEENPQEHTDLVLKSFSIQGAGETAEYTLAAKVVTPLNQVQIAGVDNIFSFMYNSYWGSDVTDLDSQPGIAVVLVNNVEVIRETIVSGGNTYSLNIGPYILNENNNIRITVSNSHGKSRSWEYTVEAKFLGIEFTQNYLQNQHIAKPAGWELPVAVSGVGGTVYVKVDNGVLSYEQYIAGGTQGSITIDSEGRFTTGTHIIEVWCENTVFGLVSEHIYTQYIANGNILSVAIGANAPKQITIYDSVQIPYYIYSPSDSAGTETVVTIDIIDNNSLVIEHFTQVATIDENHSSGLQYGVIRLMNNSLVNKTIQVKISVSEGLVYATHQIYVNSAEVVLQEAAECKVYYPFATKTNSETDVVNNSMESYYNNVRTSRLLRSDNFVLTNNNGFKDGGFIIPPKKNLTLKDWVPFSEDFGVNGTRSGKTIEIEFAVGTSADMDTPVISCIDSRCGFEIYPTRIEVKYQRSDQRVITKFPDNERIKFSLVINGTSTNCVNDDGNGHRTEQLRNLGFMFVNGVIVRIFDYDTSSWLQSTPKEIVFGSSESTITLYSIRGYDKALSMREVIANYSYDTPVLENKISIAKRNNILQSDGLTVDKNLVEQALPNTPIITWWMEQLPANKKDPQECKQTDFVNPKWTAANGHSCASFTAGSHEINGDGTSSNAYPLPYKNWAEKFKDYNGGSQGIITLHLEEEDVTVKKYSITYGIEDKETKFVHKVNFASSEGIFNILAMNMYQLITLNSYRNIPDILSIQQQAQVDNDEAIVFRKSLSGFPEIGFRMYTENGRIVTKFISIYNFINNKKTGSMFGMVDDYKVNQLWEVDENVNFFNTIMTDHTVVNDQLVPSNGVREVSPMYYSRFPADSPVNEDCDLGLPDDISQVAQANDEIKALKDIHNWIVSINPNVAERYKARYGEYRSFTIEEDGFTSITYDGDTFDKDTPAYRSRKFNAEYQDHLHLNDCIFYFIFCTYILGMDSMDKNMSLFLDTVEDFYSDDPDVRAAAKVKLRIMLRDTDSGELFNNSGVLSYQYWHEWNDTYNPSTGETGQIIGEAYNSETRTYDIVTNVPGSSPVFNGRLSGLWDAINRYVPNNIRSVYQTMRNAGLNFDTFFEMYQDFRNYWCEALYNVDGLGYANTGNFNMAYGDKLMLSKYFFKFRERYMDSKYAAVPANRKATLRLSSVPTGIWMKHCTPIYASFDYGVGNTVSVRSINVGEPALLPVPNDVSTFNDATCYVNDPDLITEIGTYTIGTNNTINYSGFEGIRNFHFTLNFERFERLQKFIWANTSAAPNIEQTDDGYVKFDNLKMLKELVMTYCTQWNANVVIGSDIIEKIDFRGTPIKSIDIPETATLKELYLPDSITSLTLKNMTGLETVTFDGYSSIQRLYIENSNVDIYTLLKSIYQASSNANETNLEYLRCYNIYITLAETDLNFLMWLTTIEDIELTGRIVLNDNIRLTYQQKAQLVEKFGNIDSDDNPLRIIYYYQETSGLTINIFCDGVADCIQSTGTYQFKAIPMVGSVERQDINYISGISWSLPENEYATINDKGLLTVSNIGVGEDTVIPLTVTASLINGSVITDTMNLRLYIRDIQLGDYVYCDGTYSDNWIKSKTCVGILFIKDTNTNMKVLCSLEILRSIRWGLEPIYMPDVTIDGITEVYNTPVVDLINYRSIVTTDTNSAYFKVADDDFVALASNVPAGDFIYEPNVTNTILDVTFELNKTYSRGYRNTITLISHRNDVLGGLNLEIPADSPIKTEYQRLTELCDYMRTQGDNDYADEYYYPAASYCYAYQPTIRSYETLHYKFMKHRWYLPSSGELGRIAFYYNRNDTTGISRYDAFAKAKEENKLFNINMGMFSSSEATDSIALVYRNHNKGLDYSDGDGRGSKFQGLAVIPTCAI